MTEPLRIGDVEKEIEKDKEKDKEKDNKNISLELKDSKQNTFISLPLVTGSGNYDVTFDYLNSLRELFPALDVEQEFRSMAAWLDSHPRNRKTPRNQEIYHWLVRTFTEFNAGIQNTASTCSYKEHVNESVYGGNGRLVRRDG